MEKACECCKRRFIPYPAVRHQEYCSDPECQKTCKRKWQREKLVNDSDYRANQAEAQPEQGLLEAVPQEESGLHRAESYGSEGTQPAEAIGGRDCKDGRGKGRNRYQIGPLPAGAFLQLGDCKDGRADRGTGCYIGELRCWSGRIVIAKRGLARNWMRAVISFQKMKEQLCIEEISVSEVGEKYGALRIVSPRADAAMVKSLRKYGQISPVVCVKGEGRYELIDGFKRLRACRRLDKTTLRAKGMEVNARVCKAAMIQLNQSGRSINEMEEALVVQSLHREDGLTQTEIGVLLGRDKSWVSRRISLIERLSEEVQEDIRLGLISVMTGRDLAKLPRGNQKEAADAILKGRYSTREAAKLIGYLLSHPRWEYSTILASPWEVVEPRQPKPRGFGAKLVSFREVCQTVSEGFSKCSAERRMTLSPLIHLAINFAEEVVKTLRTAP